MREYVSASVDGELSEVEGAMVESHLARCTTCRAYAAETAETARMLRAAPLEELTFPIVLPGRRLAVARKLQVAAAAAAVAVAVGIGASVGTGHGPGQNPTASTASAVGFRWSTEAELRMLHRASLREQTSEHAHLAL
jgi:predicted anti-sigma-YlaC factor YlaD